MQWGERTLRQTLEHTYSKKIGTTGGASDRKILLRLEEKKRISQAFKKKYFLIFIYSKLPLPYPNNYNKEQFCSFSIG